MSTKQSILFFTLLLVIAGVSAQAVASVHADYGEGPNCYTGIYFNDGIGNVYQTQNVIMGMNFPYGWTPSGWGSHWVAGVMTVAGYSSGTSPSSFWYQNGAALNNDGTVSWSPQIKKWSTGTNWFYGSLNIGSVSAISYYLRINRLAANDFQFKAYVYSTFTQFEHDAPSIYTWNLPHDAVFSDAGFLVGVQYDNFQPPAHQYHHLQFGWESDMQVPVSSSWYFQNFGMGYKSSGTWKYKPGKVNSYFGSYNTWYWSGNTLYSIRVGRDYSSTVRYYAGGTDMSMFHGHSPSGWDSDGTVVWSSSGTVSHAVNTPYA